MALEQVHLLVHGHVQGVWYRKTTLDRATALGLVGWVRNLPNGSVELLAVGHRAALDALVTFCHEGPQHARVDQVHATWSLDAPSYPRFEILHK